MSVYINTVNLLKDWLCNCIQFEKGDLDSFCSKIITYTNTHLNTKQRSNRRIILRKHAFDLLWLLGSKKTALLFADDIISEARLFGLHEIVINTARKIIIQGSIESQDITKYRNYLINSQGVLSIEIEAELLFVDLVRAYKNGADLNMFSKEAKVLTDKVNRIQSYKAHYRTFYINNIIQESAGNKEFIIENSLVAYQYFNSLEFDHTGTKILFLRQAFEACVELNQIEKAKSILSVYVDKKSAVTSTGDVFRKEMIAKVHKLEGNLETALQTALSIKELPFYDSETKQTKKRVEKLIESLRDDMEGKKELQIT